MNNGNITNHMTTEHKFVGGIVVVSLVILIGGAWFLNVKDNKERGRADQPFVGEKMPDMGAAHVARNATHPPYNSNPPTSGWHWGDGVAGPGIKDRPMPDELVLHSMEHGAAVLWYQDDMAPEDVERLRKVFNDSSGKKIMLPRKDLEVPVALASWGYLLKLETIDEAKIKEFIETNNDRAPEKAPI